MRKNYEERSLRKVTKKTERKRVQKGGSKQGRKAV